MYINTSSEHLPKRAKTAALRQVQVCFHSAKRLRFKKHAFYIFDYILPSDKNQVFSSPKEKEIIRSTRLFG